MKRKRDDRHLDTIRQLPCAICLDDTSTEAAHVRYAEPKLGKRQTGMGEKPDDAFTVPLCGRHHREQHTQNERAWWGGYEIDPLAMALALYRVSGDHEAGERIVRAWH